MLWTLNMCLVTVILSAYIQALISGRIYKQQPRQTHDPVSQPSPGGQDFPVDYNNYMRQLQCHEWAMFEVHERHFRRSLDTKQLQERTYFACSGDPKKWTKVASFLIGVFFPKWNISCATCQREGVRITTSEIRDTSPKKVSPDR